MGASLESFDAPAPQAAGIVLFTSTSCWMSFALWSSRQRSWKLVLPSSFRALWLPLVGDGQFCREVGPLVFSRTGRRVAACAFVDISQQGARRTCARACIGAGLAFGGHGLAAGF
eukprot:7540903-Alexandrium_andersonii.AAC.1